MFLCQVKTRLQSKIAETAGAELGASWTGHQHKIQGMWSALATAYASEGGVLGLWRGVRSFLSVFWYFSFGNSRPAAT